MQLYALCMESQTCISWTAWSSNASQPLHLVLKESNSQICVLEIKVSEWDLGKNCTRFSKSCLLHFMEDLGIFKGSIHIQKFYTMYQRYKMLFHWKPFCLQTLRLLLFSLIPKLTLWKNRETVCIPFCKWRYWNRVRSSAGTWLNGWPESLHKAAWGPVVYLKCCLCFHDRPFALILIFKDCVKILLTLITESFSPQASAWFVLSGPAKQMD